MSMLSIQVDDWGHPPKAVRALPPPVPQHESEIQLHVLAAGLHQIVRTRAAGKHYSKASAPDEDALPHTLGVDGVGEDIATGKVMYFSTLGSGVGSFAEYVNVPKEDAHELPEGVDVVQAAGLMNPVMGSWMGLRKRVGFIMRGEKRSWSCLVMGVTSMSGRMAVRVARAMGATKVIGAARNEETLKTLDLDSYIVLRDPVSKTDFSPAAHVDVVLDFLYGPYLAAYLMGTTSETPVTWVCIGSLAGLKAEVPGVALRRRDVTIRGAGPGAWKMGELGGEMEGMLGVLRGVREEVKSVRMESVEEGWEAKERVVFVNEREKK